MLIGWFVLIAFCFLLRSDVSRSSSPEYALVDDLLAHYSPANGGRPVATLGQPLMVNLTFVLLHMNEVNDVDQTISVLAGLRIQWRDPFLAWNGGLQANPALTKYSHIPSVSLKSSAIWTPRILHFNNVEDQQVVMQFGERSQVSVESDGQATWEPTGIFTSNCQLTLAKFPFDKQTCQIQFDSWLNNDLLQFDYVDYSIGGDEVVGQGSIWSLTSFAVGMNNNERYNQAYYTIGMKRNIQYFLYNIIIPCILLSILQLATFCLNPESPDRPAFSVSVLVAFGIFQIMIQEQIPKTSELIFLLLYIIIQFAIGTVITILSAVMCYLIGLKTALRTNGDNAAKRSLYDDDPEIYDFLIKIKRFDQVSFAIVFLATCASHAVIFAYISL